jgi:hypothetical protein
MTTGTMDMQSLMDMSRQMENMQGGCGGCHNEPAEQPARVVISCDGCEHMCASPVECVHPVSMSVRWDPIRNRAYRMPSIELCISEGGMCRFYDPDTERGAGTIAIKKRKNKAKVTKIDEVLDQIDDDNVPIEDFLENLRNLDDELNKEERGEEDDGTKDTEGS